MSQQLQDGSKVPAFQPVPPAPETLSWPQVWTLLIGLAAVGAGVAQLLTKSQLIGLFLPALALLVCLVAAWHDAATGRIPNPLTLTALVIGLTFNLLAPLLFHFGLQNPAHWLGMAEPWDGLYGFAFAAAIGLIAYLLAGLGGGDLKLMTAVGSLLGYQQVWPMLLWALLIAVPYSVLNLLLAGRVNRAMQIVAVEILTLVYLHKPAAVPIECKSKRTFPLAVSLFLGLLAARIVSGDQLLMLSR